MLHSQKASEFAGEGGSVHDYHISVEHRLFACCAEYLTYSYTC